MQKIKGLVNLPRQSFKTFLLIIIIEISFENQAQSQSIFADQINCKEGELFFESTSVNKVSAPNQRDGLWILSSCQDSTTAIIGHSTELDSLGNLFESFSIEQNEIGLCECKAKDLRISISAMGQYNGDLLNGMWHYFDKKGNLIAVSFFKDDILQQATIFRNGSVGQVDYISISADHNNYNLFLWSSELKSHKYEVMDYSKVIDYFANQMLKNM